jgi:hypothetical protein
VRNDPLQLEVNGNGPFSPRQTLLLESGRPNNYANLTRGIAMRSPILAIAFGFVLVSASAALADQTQQPTAQPVSAVSTTPDPNPVICHGLVHDGVLLHSSECHTKHEWNAIQFRNQQAIREFQDSALTTTPK